MTLCSKCYIVDVYNMFLLLPQLSGRQLCILEVLGRRSFLYQLPSISIQYVAINQILPEIITCPETASVLCTYLWLSHKPLLVSFDFFMINRSAIISQSIHPFPGRLCRKEM